MSHSTEGGHRVDGCGRLENVKTFRFLFISIRLPSKTHAHTHPDILSDNTQTQTPLMTYGHGHLFKWPSPGQCRIQILAPTSTVPGETQNEVTHRPGITVLMLVYRLLCILHDTHTPFGSSGHQPGAPTAANVIPCRARPTPRQIDVESCPAT